MNDNILTIGAIALVVTGLGALAVQRLTTKTSAEEPIETEPAAQAEPFGDWREIDATFEPLTFAGGFLRFSAGFFGVWSVLAFIVAEIDWDTTPARDGMIGVGSSAYALVHYARAIALAAISAALSMFSQGIGKLRRLRIAYRTAEKSR